MFFPIVRFAKAISEPTYNRVADVNPIVLILFLYKIVMVVSLKPVGFKIVDRCFRQKRYMPGNCFSLKIEAERRQNKKR